MAEVHTVEAASRSSFSVKHVAIAIGVASLVGWIDWGGVDRPTSDRVLAGLFAYMSATGFIAARLLQGFRAHPSWVASQYCGVASSAFLTVSMLTDGVVAIGFAIPGLVCLAAEVSNAREYRRAIRSGTASSHIRGDTVQR